MRFVLRRRGAVTLFANLQVFLHISDTADKQRVRRRGGRERNIYINIYIYKKDCKSSRFYVTYKLTQGFQNITCYLAGVGQLPVTLPFFFYSPTSSSMSPCVVLVIGLMLITVPRSLRSRPAVRQGLSSVLGKPGM